MNRCHLTILATFCAACILSAQPLPLPAPLTEETLRVDYIFSGTDTTCTIALDGLSRFDGWAGRRVNRDTLLLRGNGQLRMREEGSGRLL